MKKKILAAAMALLLSAGTFTTAAPVFTQTVFAESDSKSIYYVDVSDFLSVRASASSSSAELYRLSDGTIVNVRGWSGNWAYVYVPSVDDYGYVYGGYLVRGSESEGKVRYVSVNTFLSLRSQPTSSSTEIRRLSNGTKVIIQSSGSSWSYVYVPSTDEYGYVYNDYLTSTNPDRYAGTAYYADVSDFLSLRSQPTSSSTEITRMDPGTEVRVLSYSGNWAYVYVPSADSYGYAYSGYLSSNDPSEEGTLYYTNVRTFLSVRSQPTSSSTELHRLSRGVRVRVLSTTGSWGYAYIPATDDYGYVYMGYLSRTRPV